MLLRRKPWKKGRVTSRRGAEPRVGTTVGARRGAPHSTLGIGSHAATRIALLPTWVVAGGW
jgi:hypothetical protein